MKDKKKKKKNERKNKKGHQSFKRDWCYIQVFQPLYPFLNNFFIATLSTGLSFQSTIFALFLGFCIDLVRSKQSQNMW